MTMSNTLQRAFIHTYFQGLIPTEHAEYLQIHYGDSDEDWSVQPAMLSVWLKEDLDQFRSESFDNDENIDRRRLRIYLKELACGADEMHRDEILTETEVRAISDVLYWIYLSRTCPAKAQQFNHPLPFDMEW